VDRESATRRFALTGPLPLNTHGGLLSYGHCGVAGGLAHLAEVIAQLRDEAGTRALPRRPPDRLRARRRRACCPRT
jgi:acetyl-CoA C-acetyltransferase